MVLTARHVAVRGTIAAGPIADDLIPRIEIARKFGVSEHTLRNWKLAGRGPPTIRIGKRTEPSRSTADCSTGNTTVT